MTLGCSKQKDFFSPFLFRDFSKRARRIPSALELGWLLIIVHNEDTAVEKNLQVEVSSHRSSLLTLRENRIQFDSIDHRFYFLIVEVAVLL